MAARKEKRTNIWVFRGMYLTLYRVFLNVKCSRWGWGYSLYFWLFQFSTTLLCISKNGWSWSEIYKNLDLIGKHFMLLTVKCSGSSWSHSVHFRLQIFLSQKWLAIEQSWVKSGILEQIYWVPLILWCSRSIGGQCTCFKMACNSKTASYIEGNGPKLILNSGRK